MAIQAPERNGTALIVDGKPVVIADLPIVAFELRLVGITPLIVNRFGDMAISKLEASQQASGRAPKVARDPEAEFEDALYRMPEGSRYPYGFPAGAIKKALYAAAVRMSAKAQKGTEVLAAFTIKTSDGLLLPIVTDKPPRMRTDHIVRAGTGGVAYRPEFNPWEIVAPVTLYLPSLSIAEFVQLARMAGFGIGLGNWRPEKKGEFGTFDVKVG